MSKITVVKEIRKNNRLYYDCVCFCGNGFVARADNIKSGITKSCGCLRKKNSGRTHGGSKDPEYKVWKSMLQRCNKVYDKSYDKYGGRGISVSLSWTKYENFINDMGKRPSNKHTIERIDNDGNYCKENCKWATYYEQAINRSKRKGASSRFIGVSYDRESKKWKACMFRKGVQKTIGRYNTELEAQNAYKQYLKENQ